MRATFKLLTDFQAKWTISDEQQRMLDDEKAELGDDENFHQVNEHLNMCLRRAFSRDPRQIMTQERVMKQVGWMRAIVFKDLYTKIEDLADLHRKASRVNHSLTPDHLL